MEKSSNFVIVEKLFDPLLYRVFWLFQIQFSCQIIFMIDFVNKSTLGSLDVH